MIARAEHTATQIQFDGIAEQTAQALAEQLQGITDARKSVTLGLQMLEQYHDEINKTLLQGLHDVGFRAAAHYNQILDLGLTEDALHARVISHIERQFKEPYHGANLGDRLYMNKIGSTTKFTKASNTGAELSTRQQNLVRHFAHPYPYGAQVNRDKRILLAQAVFLEHSLAKDLGQEAGVQFVAWTLSHQHSKPDICDHLAAQITPKVAQALKEAKIKLDPKGVYFIGETPNLPHPNCRCTLRYVKDQKLTPSTAKRSAAALRKLWNIIRRR